MICLEYLTIGSLAISMRLVELYQPKYQKSSKSDPILP